MKWLLLVAMAGLTVGTFLAPPADTFPNEDLARIIFFHLPPAFGCLVFLFAGAWFSFRYLKTRDLQWDARAIAANEMGFLLSLLTMASGVIFSRVQWGAWWHWDPRQTSFLFVLLLYAAYFALRAAYTDEVKRAGTSAAYALINLLPTIFLIGVLPRLMKSLHPNTSVQDTISGEGGFDRTYWFLILSIFIVIVMICTWLYRLHVRAGLLELKLRNGELDAGGDTASTGVVRTVSLSQES